MTMDFGFQRSDLRQVGWVVDDLDAAIKTWLETTGAGPFYVMRHVAPESTRYRGKPASVDTSLAMAQFGGIQIELIEQHDDVPSAYRDSVPVGTSAVHHLGGFAQDFDAEVERYVKLGIDIAYEGLFGDMRFAYIDTRSTIGCMTELMEPRPIILDLFAMVEEGSRNWDGSDPVRLVGD
ncbi:VOC family protein [Actinomadura sp. LOL_016]|uniref:VOC family protein n=1 Tax=unclassified Actinomadura TaxID=2626254 RepID=UPI003A81196C